MSKYEFTFLLNEESELKGINNLVNSLSGKIIKEESWGEKLLSYPVKGHLKAQIYQWIIDLPPNKVKEFRTKLGFNNKIIRYLILNQEL